MDNLFNIDNKFFRTLGKLVDCFCLSVLWLVVSLPIFTIGASTTALYDTAYRVRRRGGGYLWRTFWGSFKSNFKQTTKIWLIMLAIFVVIFVDCWVTRAYLKEGVTLGLLYYFFLIMGLFEYVWMIFTFGCAARFELGMKDVMKNGILLAIAKLPWSFLIIAILMVVLIVIQYLPFLIFLFPAVMALTHSFILERIFRKIMKPEDLEKVLENDIEDLN